MKKLPIVLVFLGLFHTCLSQGKLTFYTTTMRNDKQFIVNNKIRRELIYSFIFTKKGIKDSTLTESLDFDSSGDMIRSIQGRPHPDTTKFTYEFNPDHSLHRIITQYSYYLRPVSIEEYKYDSAGNVKTIYTYDPDTIRTKTQKRVFNEKNQLICTYIRFGSGNFNLETRRYYSEDGDSAKTEIYDPKGQLDYAYIFNLDKVANKKTTYREDKEGKRLVEEFVYDSARRVIQYNTRPTERLNPSWSAAGDKPVEHDVEVDITYNPDGTLFEFLMQADKIKKELIRNYYLKD